MRQRTDFPFAAAAIIASVIGSPLAGHAETAQEAAPDAPAIPTPTPTQLVWQDCEIGLLFCSDLPIAAGICDLPATKSNA